MRLIGDFPTESEVFAFHSFLLQKGIKSVYELSSELSDKRFRLWAVNEEDVEMVKQYYEEFKKSPQGVEVSPVKGSSLEEDPFGVKAISIKKFFPKLTLFFIVLCGIIFCINQVEESRIYKEQSALALDVGLTPLQREMLYDYPASAEALREFVYKHSLKNLDDVKKLSQTDQQTFSRVIQMPTWQGVLHTSSKNAPLFEKIRQGEIWRIVTPAFLHRDFLHILFNMIWLFILGRQMEERLKIVRTTLFVVLVAAISNTCQYLMNGPFFLGFSGVAVGMATFIWLREKIAPWEGYTLRKSTLFFLFAFVISMVVLEISIFIFDKVSQTGAAGSMANTAHVVGGLVGLILAKVPFFYRRLKPL